MAYDFIAESGFHTYRVYDIQKCAKVACPRSASQTNIYVSDLNGIFSTKGIFLNDNLPTANYQNEMTSNGKDGSGKYFMPVYTNLSIQYAGALEPADDIVDQPQEVDDDNLLGDPI